MERIEKLIFRILVGGAIFFSFPVAARTCLSPMTLQAMRAGQLSPVRQFIANNECMDNCVRSAFEVLPENLEPYVTSVARANQIRCIMEACHQEATLLSVLPMVKAAFDQDYANKFLASVLQSMSQNRCGMQLDPMWMQLFMGR